MYKDLDTDFDILQAPLRLLRFHQLWPPQGKSASNLGFVVRFFCLIFLCSFPIFCGMNHILFMYNNPDTILLIDIVEHLVTLIVYTIVYYTIYALIIHIRELNVFMHDLNDYTRFGKPPGIEEVNRKANYFTYFFYIYGWSGSVIYSLSGVMRRNECLKHAHITRACGFLLPLKFPFDLDKKNFIAAWFLLAFSLNSFLTSGITVMTYLYSSVEILNAKIVHLKEEIMKLGEKPEIARERIRYCVEYHVKIIEMCQNLNTCWGSLMLYHQMLVSILESLIGIQFLLQPDINCISHASAWLISLAIPCYAGQRLLDESSEIPMAIYSSNWYNLDKNSRKDLIYMLMCANNYLDLNRDGYGPINLSIVGQVINNIYSVLTLLHSTMADLKDN